MRRWKTDADHYRHGDFNVICDRSGFKVKASDTRIEWTGKRVRVEDWDPRHPQDFVKGKADRQAVPNGRPEPADRFLSRTVTKDEL